MNRHGSLIWWLVCIGLVLCWVWNFQTAVKSNSDDMSSIELDNQEKLAKDIKPTEPFRLPRMDANIMRANQIVDQMAQAPVVATAQETPMESELLQTSTFGADEQLQPEVPFIDLSEDPSMNSVPMMADQPALPMVEPQMIDPIALPTSPAASINSSSESWQQNQFSERKNSEQRVSNPYFDEAPKTSTTPADPVLTFDNMPASGSEFNKVSELSLDQVAEIKTEQTEFGSFEDLKQEQSQWTKENTIAVTPADQFVSGTENNSAMITPIMPAGQPLTGDSTTVQQCVNHIEYGKSLARRGAAFAAREEFYSALRLMAQSNDAQTRSTNYTTALREAVTALNEADDFYSEISHEGMDVNVAQVVEAHTSRIIAKDRAQGMSSMIAIQAYFEFARTRLGEAFGQNVVASEALYSLGKLFTVAAAHDLTGNPLDYSKSIVMHYTAIDCNSGNYRSTNELGVLMARNGRLEKARDLFRESLLVEKMPQTWKNLAIVHDRIAKSSNNPQTASENRELAMQAGREFEIAQQTSPGMTPKVQWVSPEQFENTAPPEFDEVRTAQAQPVPTQTPREKPGILSRWKDLF